MWKAQKGMTGGPEGMVSGRRDGETCVGKGARMFSTVHKGLELVLLAMGNQWKFYGETSVGLCLGVLIMYHII